MMLSSLSLALTRAGLLTFLPSALFANGEQGAWYDPSDFLPNWRRNLLTYSEQFDNAAWNKSANTQVTANTTAAPDDTLTADQILAVTSSSNSARQFPAVAASTTYTFSVYIKAASSQWAFFTLYDNGSNVRRIWFNVSTGVVGSTTFGGAFVLVGSAITAVGNGWYRCSVSATMPSGISYCFFGVESASADTALDDVVNGSLLIWGAQLEVGSTATAYQKITDGIQDYYTYQAQPVLFQDSAGTTPVTAVEQPVGRMLDKSGRGNHAFQSTSASRPVLSARVNLLTKTEQFDDAVWGKTATSVTGNAATAPNGTLTASQSVASTGSWLIYQAVSQTSGVTYTISAYVKSATGGNQTFRLYGNDAIASGDFTATTSWQLFTFTFTANSTGAGKQNGLAFSSGNTTASLYIWGADLRVSNDGVGIPAYQRVNTSTDYDTAGFPLYLKTDGVDDWMQTNSINFTSTDKMTVWAGVRKVVDSGTVGVICELSSDSVNTNGTFAFFTKN